MADLIDFSSSSCEGCCGQVKLKGCVNGVAHIVTVDTSQTPPAITVINLTTADVSSTIPAGFVTGDCPGVSDYEFDVLCDAANGNTQFIRIISWNNSTGVSSVTNVQTNGTTPYVPVNPINAVRCSGEKFDISAPILYCDGGVALYATEVYDVSGATPVFFSRIFRNALGVVITPSGAVTLGACPTTIPGGAVSIGSGTFAATLGPNGTSWTPPAAYRSVTVMARRSNTTNATNTAPSRVQINFVGGAYKVLLTNEIHTWSVEDANRLGGILNVQLAGNAAASINWN